MAYEMRISDWSSDVCSSDLRGGRYTYHGPGQRTGYIQIDLGARGKDVRNFVHNLEDWVIAALGELGVAARRDEGRIGIWTDAPDGRAAKLGAICVRVGACVGRGSGRGGVCERG